MSNEDFLNSISKDYYDFVKLGLQSIRSFDYDKIGGISSSLSSDDIACFFLNTLYLYKAKGCLVLDEHGFSMYIYSTLYGNSDFIPDNYKWMYIFKHPDITKLNAKYITPTMVLRSYMNSEKFIEFLEDHGFRKKESALKELDEIIEEEKKDIEKKLEIEEKEYYENKKIEYKNNKSYDVINYLEYVGKIYTYLDNYNNMNIVGNEESSKKIISYFIALFYFVDSNVKTQFSGKIRQLFESGKLKLEDITNLLNIDLSTIDNIDPYKYLNKKFFEYSSKETKFIDLIKEHFVDLTEERIIINKLLNKLNIDSSLIDDLYNLVYNIEKNKDNLSLDEYKSKLNVKMINFIEDSFKIYKIILNEKSKFINNDNDYVSLAILINYYFNNYKRLEYFKNKNINLDTIYNITGIKPVNSENLDSIKVDENEIIKFYSLLGSNVNNKLRNFEDCTFNSDIMKKLYYSITGFVIPVNIIDVITNYLNKKQKEENDKLIDELFKDMDVSIYKFFTHVMLYYRALKNRNLQGKNAEALALLLGTCYFPCKEHDYFVNELELNYDNLLIQMKIHLCEMIINPSIIKEKFSDFIFGGVNEGRNRKDITVASILSNISNKSINDSFQLKNILNSCDVDLSDFDDLENKIVKYELLQEEKEKIQKAKEENEKIENGIKKLKEQTVDILECLTIAFKIQEDLMLKKEKLHYIQKRSDAYSISIVIASLLMDTKFKAYFDNEGLTLKYILEKIGYNIQDLKSLDFKNVTDRDLYYNNEKYLEKGYFDDYQTFSIEENRYKKNEFQKQDLGYLLRRIVGGVVEDNFILRKIVCDDEKFTKLLLNLTNEVDVKVILPVEELLDELKQEVENIPTVDVSNRDKILEFMLEGDKGLSKYSDYIISLISEINKYLNLDESIESLDTLAEQVYVDTPIKTGLITKIFKSSKNIQRSVNPLILKELSESIDDNIANLDIQIKKYREIFKAIGLYISAIKNHQILNEYIISKIDEEIKDYKDETSLEYLDCIQIKQGIIIKLTAYNNTITMMKQQQLHLFQTIQNHITTRTALQTSKNDVIPVIGSEMLFNIGNMSQKESLELSNNLVVLFKGIIGNNVEVTKKSLEALKITDIPQDLLDSITLYIEQLDENNELDNPKIKQI